MKKYFVAAGLALACTALPAVATVPDGTNNLVATGNGTTTDYTLPFRLLKATDLVVTVNLVVKTWPTDFTVKGTGSTAPVLHFLVAPANGTAITIRRDTKLEQPTSLRSQGDFAPAAHQNAWDRLEMQLIDLRNSCLPAPGFRLKGEVCTTTSDCGAGLACLAGGVCG